MNDPHERARRNLVIFRIAVGGVPILIVAGRGSLGIVPSQAGV
jgi:hypothetical protein